MADRKEFETALAEAQGLTPLEISIHWCAESEDYLYAEYQTAWLAWRLSTLQFAEPLGKLQVWHAERIKKLQMILDMPEGTSITLESADGETVTLDNKAAAGFKAGVFTALELFARLPLRMSGVCRD